MIEDYLYRINCHESVRPHLHNFPFDEDNILLRIDFDDSNDQILGDGHVAMIEKGKKNTLYYAAYEPIKQECYDLHQEPYSEALDIVKKQKALDVQCIASE